MELGIVLFLRKLRSSCLEGKSLMEWGIVLFLRKLRSSCLEGHTALIQPGFNFFTRSNAGAQEQPRGAHHGFPLARE
jgi:hypothetical protein